MSDMIERIEKTVAEESTEALRQVVTYGPARVESYVTAAKRNVEANRYGPATTVLSSAAEELALLRAARAELARRENVERVAQASRVLEALRAVNLDALGPDDVRHVCAARDYLREMGAKPA